MAMGSLILRFLPLFFVAFACGHFLPKESNPLHPAIIRTPIRRDARAEFEKPDVYEAQAKSAIERKINLPRIETPAKNLILMIGDGMGVSTVTASRILKGQTEGAAFGEEAQHHMETFPYVGTSKTYCSDVQVADSACSTTAYSCGAKGNVGTIGVTPVVLRKNCAESLKEENRVSSVLHWAQTLGKSTGIVTTTKITDASPAGSYAHVADRDWEYDGAVEDAGHDPTTCIDIAQQLIHGTTGKGVNVILGGGREYFMNSATADPEDATLFGRRRDGKDLITEWAGQNKSNAHYIHTRQQLLEVDVEKTDFLLGLFSAGDLEYLDKMAEANDPTLAEMVDVAIKILSKNPKGFYLFVEGGNIDNAHHGNNAHRALVETLEFDKAVHVADNSTEDDDTLIVVSADHSHLLTIAGTPPRGGSIFGFTGEGDTGDGLPATTLAYINGPGYRGQTGSPCSRPDLALDPVDDIDYKQIASYPKASSTHAGEDVLIFAKGPFAHLFTGINDQTFIAHAMRHAASGNSGNGSPRVNTGKLSFLIAVVIPLLWKMLPDIAS